MDAILAPDTTNLQKALDAYKYTGNYQQYRQYLRGEQPLEYATEKFKSAFGRQFQTFAYNRCAPVVDAHADRLQVEGFGADNEAISQEAQDIWDDNQMDVREGQVEVEAFGMGDGYVIVEKHPKTGDIQIWPQYAESIRVQYSDEEPNRRAWATRRWLEDKYLRFNIYYPDRIEKYRSRQPMSGESIPVEVKADMLEPWQPEGDAQWPVMLDVDDTVPVFHFANNGRTNSYGQSELRDVIPLQDAINKTVMDMLVAMEFAAFPQRVILDVDVGDDATADAIRRFQTGIDRILTLTGSGEGKAAIAEFSAAAMVQYLDVAEKFDQFIARVTKIPSRYLTQEATAISGTSKRMDESAFVSKIEDRQRAFGTVWSEVIRYALRLTGTEVEPGAIRVNWVPAAPLSNEEQMEQALGMNSLGFPLDSILREVWGYEPEQIEQIMAERKAAMDEQAAQFNRGLTAVAIEEEEAA